MNIDQLNEAFRNFASASHSLEAYYGELKDKIAHLSNELEIRNKQLEDALAESHRHKEHLKTVLDHLEEAIIAVDQAGFVTMMNPSAEALLGITTADASGRQFDALDFQITNDDRESILAVQNKKYSVIVSKTAVHNSDGSIQGQVILIKDVTRLKDLEQRHERNQRLIAMGEMAAKLVHEIRNPLCSIELYAGMLERDITDPAQKNLAGGIAAGIGSLNAILTNMLFFARPKKSAPVKIRLDAVVNEAVRLLQPMMTTRGVESHLELIDAEAVGDSEMLKQVCMNILMNGMQAMPNGGRLDIRMQWREDALAIDISDTGVGIARENLERIFDPFFTTKDTGTGLGLVIASNIMQANGGYITVTSEPGRGSAFSLCFPTQKSMAASAIAQTALACAA